MKTSRLILLTFLSISMVFLSGCNEDEEPEVSPFVGDYVLVSATLSESLSLDVNESEDPLVIPDGYDITVMIQGALLGSVECEPANSLIELHEDFSLFLSCSTSEEEIDAGTWEEQSETVIILNLNSTAVPSSPTGVVLTVSDVSMIGSVLTGTTSVPVSREMIALVVAAMSGGQMTLDMEATPAAVPISFTITLNQQ
jgi:hypothetical protein